MKLKTNKILTTIGVLIFISCNRNEKIEDKKNEKEPIEIKIETTNIQDSTEISKIVEEVKIIKLNETEEGLIGGIEKLLLLNNNYVIFDPFYSNRIVIYDINGNFVKSLVKMGSGPKELTKLTEVWINEKEELEVYDNNLNKILTYDKHLNISKTSFLKNKKLFGSITKISSLPDKYINFSGYNGFLNNGKYFKMAVLDSAFNIEETYFEYNKSLNKALIPTPISPFHKSAQNEIQITQNFDPTVYTINSNKKLEKKYILDYFPKPFPRNFEKTLIEPNIREFKSEDINNNRTKEILGGSYGYRGPWLESIKYSYFTSFDVKGRSFFSIYDKENKKIIFQGYSFIESEKFKIQIPPHFYTVNSQENKFVGFYEGYITLMLLKESSPFYKMVKENIDSFYIVEVKFK